MKTLFINEVECYSVLNKYGIRLPRYSFITSITKTFHSSFKDGEDIVLKGVVDNIWHKSDQNLLKFNTFSNPEIKKTYKQFYSINPVKKDWKGLLICERINYADLSLPSELLVSIRRDNSCGNIITLGFGGLYTELWSAELLNPVLHFFPELYSETTALKQLEDSLLFKILLGKIRQGTKLTTQKRHYFGWFIRQEQFMCRVYGIEHFYRPSDDTVKHVFRWKAYPAFFKHCADYWRQSILVQI